MSRRQQILSSFTVGDLDNIVTLLSIMRALRKAGNK